MTRRSAAVLFAVAAIASACSGSSADTSTTTVPPPPTTTAIAPTTTSTTTTSTTTTSTTTSTTTTTTLPPPASALNGLAVADETVLDRRVVTVKIDNHARARPQSGIQEADAVYEMRVESGITRFIAVFHGADSEYLGPVRSGRPTDPTLVRPLGTVFQISGAQPWVLRLIRNRGIDIVPEGSTTFRVRGRSAPHNLYADTTRIRTWADDRDIADDPPPALFPTGEWAPTPGETATEITMNWADGNTVVWTWDGERYLRTQQGQEHEWVDVDGNRGRVAADVLVVVEGRLYTASPPGGDGSSVPATDTVGSGDALVFAQGGVATGTWERADIAEPFTLTDADGEPLAVPPGFPWISVFPSNRAVTWQ